MFNPYFDRIYLINLKTRPDRLKRSIREFESVGLREVEVVPAVDANKEYIPMKTFNKKMMDMVGWTKGAAALSVTTHRIIQDAKRKGYKSILIMEDDIGFHQNAAVKTNMFMNNIHKNWEMLHFGSVPRRAETTLNKYVKRLNGSFYCHCYAIRDTIYDLYADHLAKIDIPIDWVTCEYIHTRGRSFGPLTNIAYQYPDYSNIRNTKVHHPNLR